ncbi:hypothetical protein TetV_620 [Tetraselmis virus 1]|uniref:Uncharacterized protein n=1 Tax=Tetraselmis virus 1 TaxID=2060617 RepID=A0A2P0VPB9_9VIRU|nr:hypothetical protein QJ968_gp434 [Tetraselmis virus 1]AUF82702.1 hypothetical protein TetV_620 [Tetraselmis virus 1]
MTSVVHASTEEMAKNKGLEIIIRTMQTMYRNSIIVNPSNWVVIDVTDEDEYN